MHSNNRRKKLIVKNVTNYKNGVNYECNQCGYVCHGIIGGKLHLKYTHGLDEKSVKTKQFCNRCNNVFIGSVSDHMIQHREEL